MYDPDNVHVDHEGLLCDRYVNVLYRLHDPEELEFMGIRDYFGAHTLALVEWPQRGEGHFPAPDLTLSLIIDGSGRILSIRADSAAGKTLAAQLENFPKH